MNRSLLSWLPVATLAAVAISGCTPEPSPPPASGDIALQHITNCGGLQDYVEQSILETLVQSSSYWGYPEVDGAEDSSGGDGGGAAPTDYTTTNTQEAGVDEIDIVKTNGNYLFSVEDQTLYITQSWPIADTHLAASLDVDGWARGLFLDGDQLIVVSQLWNGQDSTNEFATRSWGSTRLTFVDISDPASPTVSRTVDVEGYLADGRLIDSDAYFVINTYLPIPQVFWDLLWSDEIQSQIPEWTWDETDAELETRRNNLRELLAPQVADLAAGMDLTDYLPLYRDQQAGESNDAQSLYTCTDLYRPSDVSQYSYLNVVHVDLTDGTLDATGLISDGWQVYASRDNLYVSQSSWWWWWGYGNMDLKTHIHQFNLTGGSPTYTGSGSVDGWILDQFSMSEFNDHLRVATTDIDWWWGTQSDQEGANNLFVLENQNGSLNTVGELRGIAPSERIMTARMMGDKGYLVTFRQTDPLFTLDLSDPTNPNIAGQLELPGFSSYLHPMDADHLIAVGMAGDADGNTTGLAVNLFDVSDFANPQLADQWVLHSDDWSYSEALWDHHAFTYHRGILTFPAYTYNWNGNDYEGFSGVIALAVNADGISEVGRVDHHDLVAASACIYDWSCDEYPDYWYAWMRRTVYIEDNLFSLSNYGIKVNDLNDPTIEHASVVYQPR